MNGARVTVKIKIDPSAFKTSGFSGNGLTEINCQAYSKTSGAISAAFESLSATAAPTRSDTRATMRKLCFASPESKTSLVASSINGNASRSGM